MVLPAGIVIPESFMSLLPVGLNPAAPPVPVAVQLTPESCHGIVSLIETPVASDGPVLVATIT